MQVFHLKISNLFESHCGFVCVLLPYLSYFLLFDFSHTLGGAHTAMDLLWFFHLPYFHFGNGFLLLLFVFSLLLRIFLNTSLILQNFELLAYIFELSYGLINLHHQKISYALPLISLIFYLRIIFIPIFNSFPFLMIGNNLISGIVKILLRFNIVPSLTNLVLNIFIHSKETIIILLNGMFKLNLCRLADSFLIVITPIFLGY